jgi:hypothetical protein
MRVYVKRILGSKCARMRLGYPIWEHSLPLVNLWEE